MTVPGDYHIAPPSAYARVGRLEEGFPRYYGMFQQLLLLGYLTLKISDVILALIQFLLLLGKTTLNIVEVSQSVFLQ